MPKSKKNKLHIPQKSCHFQREPQRLQESQATSTKKKIVPSSSSPPSRIIRHTNFTSQSQSPPERSQRAVSMTTDISTSRSDEGTTCKTKKRQHCSQAQTSIIQTPTDSLTKTASMLVNFIINMYKTKKPISKEDMLKIIDKKHKNHFPEIFRKASFKIEVVFGMNLIEDSANSHSYTFVSKMNLPYNGVLRCGNGFPKTGLLMHILGVIFMKGNSATEENIWEFLNKMKIYDGKRHFLFGEPRKLITKDLVELKYLEYRQVPDSDPSQYEFLWGPRAYAETSKMKVLEFWAKINDTAPSTFQSKYEEAMVDEKENTNTMN
ncbi:melanoma-associated antigen B3-like [Cavia porcellus]|uniref:melanoma-associated antigen B3-like n=1 Tax=Cavia porcellus TaxID=10141 RepID=UPI00022B655B|nr:melanoma-associated antigen B3-like [Cavia porcellus]